jgi:hypothetical protein
VATVGTAFPAVDATPNSSWAKIGKNGAKNFSGDGVKVTHGQTIVKIRPDGYTAPAKTFRTEEDLSIELTVWDMTIEAYRMVLNANGITDVPASSGVAGYRSVSLSRGPDVSQYALLVRGASPYGDNWNLQYEVPVVIHNGDPAPVFRKGTPAALLIRFEAMGDLNNPSYPFGIVKAQTATAL